MAKGARASGAPDVFVFSFVTLLATAGPAGAAANRLWNDCRSSDPAVSISACTDLIETSVGSSDEPATAYSTRGDAYAAKGDYARAIDDYNDAIRLSPRLAPYAYNARGNAYSEIGELDHALEDYTATIGLRPDYASAYFNRGLIYAGRGDFARAKRDFDLAVRIPPKSAQAFNIRGERREDRVGVWVRRPDKGAGYEDKIAAIGVRLRRWVSFHGIAINVEPNLSHFSAIVPCGVIDPRYGVTSLVDLGLPVTMEDVDVALRRAFEDVFGATCARLPEATT
jgi:tetratricopeptide (TPR) repeat protein